MRNALLAFFVLPALGCDGLDILGSDEKTTRLILSASPRQTNAEGHQLSIVAAEAVTADGSSPPDGDLCVHLSVQLGTFAGASDLPVVPDGGLDGGAACNGRCIDLLLPSGNLRRSFALYESAATSARDVVLGELIGVKCPPDPGSQPLATESLTLGVPDSPLPAIDMGAPAVADDGGAQ